MIFGSVAETSINECAATLMTVTNPSLRKRISTLFESKDDRLSTYRASAQELGSRSRFKD
jgi:hypothetical protein